MITSTDEFSRSVLIDEEFVDLGTVITQAREKEAQFVFVDNPREGTPEGARILNDISALQADFKRYRGDWHHGSVYDLREPDPVKSAGSSIRTRLGF